MNKSLSFNSSGFNFLPKSDDDHRTFTSSFSMKPSNRSKKRNTEDFLTFQIETVIKNIEELRQQRRKIEERHALCTKQLETLKQRNRNEILPGLDKIRQKSSSLNAKRRIITNRNNTLNTFRKKGTIIKSRVDKARRERFNESVGFGIKMKKFEVQLDKVHSIDQTINKLDRKTKEAIDIIMKAKDSDKKEASAYGSRAKQILAKIKSKKYIPKEIEVPKEDSFNFVDKSRITKELTRGYMINNTENRQLIEKYNVIMIGIEKMFGHLRSESGRVDSNEIAEAIINSEEHTQSVFNTMRIVNSEREELDNKIQLLEKQESELKQRIMLSKLETQLLDFPDSSQKQKTKSEILELEIIEKEKIIAQIHDSAKHALQILNINVDNDSCLRIDAFGKTTHILSKIENLSQDLFHFLDIESGKSPEFPSVREDLVTDYEEIFSRSNEISKEEIKNEENIFIPINSSIQPNSGWFLNNTELKSKAKEEFQSLNLTEHKAIGKMLLRVKRENERRLSQKVASNL